MPCRCTPFTEVFLIADTGTRYSDNGLASAGLAVYHHSHMSRSTRVRSTYAYLGPDRIRLGTS